jgi:cytochrome c oxidase subunit 2
MGDFLFPPSEASTVAGQVDAITLTLVAISGVLTLIVVVLIAYFSIKYRSGNKVDRSNPPVEHIQVELTWMGGLLVLGLGVFAWGTILFYHMHRPPADSMDIYVVGKQWMWKIQHQEGPSEINTLHVPLGQPVRLVMTSEDVIHSFYVPAFRLKQDVIPGRYTYLWFQATKVGEYHLFCAEFCGTNHSEMAEEGKQLFTQLGCAHCHAPESGVQAPNLNGLFGQTVPLSNGASVQADEDYIRQSIFFPKAKVVAGYTPIMPTYEGKLTEEQVLQLVAYIKSIGVSQ